MIDHCLQEAGFPPAAAVGKGFDVSNDLPRLLAALEMGESMMRRGEGECEGYIIQKVCRYFVEHGSFNVYSYFSKCRYSIEHGYTIRCVSVIVDVDSL